MTYPKVVNILLKKYATEEVVKETESDITRFEEQSNVMLSQYAEELVSKTHHRKDLYKEYALSEILIGGLDAPIRHSMREYWENKKDDN